MNNPRMSSTSIFHQGCPISDCSSIWRLHRRASAASWAFLRLPSTVPLPEASPMLDGLVLLLELDLPGHEVTLRRSDEQCKITAGVRRIQIAKSLRNSLRGSLLRTSPALWPVRRSSLGLGSVHLFGQSKQKKGILHCEVCEWGRSFEFPEYLTAALEAHHVVPLSEHEVQDTRLTDLALLCANCHRLIHRMIAVQNRWVGIPECVALFRTAPCS
jgi:5-methylcytosine-specific restriction endonuclease McrA